jgi:hypothetical protein
VIVTLAGAVGAGVAVPVGVAVGAEEFVDVGDADGAGVSCEFATMTVKYEMPAPTVYVAPVLWKV